MRAPEPPRFPVGPFRGDGTGTIPVFLNILEVGGRLQFDGQESILLDRYWFFITLIGMVKPVFKEKKADPVQHGLGQRQTRQRDIIFGLIRGANGPLTIPQIHEGALKVLKAKRDAKTKTIGIATVYRTVNLLQEGKLVHSVVLPTGETRYESSHLDAHHHHFQCRKCEHVYDLGICPVGIPDGTTIPGGFQVDSHELTLFGLCPDCVPGRKAR